MIIDDSFYEAANKFLVALGAPLTKENVNLLAAWSYCEKPHYPGSAWQGNNPWNTTMPCCHWTGNLNDVGVKIYPTKEDGIEANRRTILNGLYQTMVSAIMSSNPEQFLSARDEISTWGTNADCIRSIYNSLSAPPDWSLIPPGSPSGTMSEAEACTQSGGIWDGSKCVYPAPVTPIVLLPIIPLVSILSGATGVATILASRQELQWGDGFMANKGLVVGGVLLLGGAAGLTYWLYSRYMLPQSYISSASIARDGSGIATVTANVTNVGKRAGYFKIQAMIVSPNCPYQGTSGLYGRGGANWDNILLWLSQQPVTRGIWLGAPTGVGWQMINPGQQMALQATSPPPIPAGTYNVYINAAVSKDGTSTHRLRSNEYYLWLPNVNIA